MILADATGLPAVSRELKRTVDKSMYMRMTSAVLLVLAKKKRELRFGGAQIVQLGNELVNP